MREDLIGDSQALDILAALVAYSTGDERYCRNGREWV